MKAAIRLAALVLFMITAMAVAAADAAAPEEGRDYKPVNPPQATKSGDRIEVLEIFWYGCPHCYQFEPKLREWLAHKPEDVEFRRMPAIFREAWVPAAKAYFTAEALGMLDQFHAAAFNAIHEKKRKFPTAEAWAELFAELGVSRDDFAAAYDSFTVDGKWREAAQLSQAYGIAGVPALVINGRYQTSGGMADSYEDLLKTVDALIAKARQESAPKP
jgi:thiol:disulfide interchange protein DsbA